MKYVHTQTQTGGRSNCGALGGCAGVVAWCAIPPLGVFVHASALGVAVASVGEVAAALAVVVVLVIVVDVDVVAVVVRPAATVPGRCLGAADSQSNFHNNANLRVLKLVLRSPRGPI